MAPWEQRTQKMYDKMVFTSRLTAWYGIQNIVIPKKIKKQFIHGLLNCFH